MRLASCLPPSSTPVVLTPIECQGYCVSGFKGKHGPSSWPCHHRRSWRRPWRRSSCRPSWAASAQHRGEPTALSPQRTAGSHGVWGALAGLYARARPGTRCGHSGQGLDSALAGQHVAQVPEASGAARSSGSVSAAEPGPKPAVCRQDHQAGRPPHRLRRPAVAMDAGLTLANAGDERAKQHGTTRSKLVTILQIPLLQIPLFSKFTPPPLPHTT